MQLCENTDDCFFGNYPTLAEMKDCYGENMASAWLVPQLNNLSEYCGCRDKLQGVPLRECAFTISRYFSYLKISELMLFFSRFKSGRYGRFYGSVDPLVINTALRDFVKERADEIDKREYAERQQQREADRKEAVTWEQYSIQTYGEIRPHPMALNMDSIIKKAK